MGGLEAALYQDTKTVNIRMSVKPIFRSVLPPQIHTYPQLSRRWNAIRWREMLSRPPPPIGCREAQSQRGGLFVADHDPTPGSSCFSAARFLVDTAHPATTRGGSFEPGGSHPSRRRRTRCNYPRSTEMSPLWGWGKSSSSFQTLQNCGQRSVCEKGGLRDCSSQPNCGGFRSGSLARVGGLLEGQSSRQDSLQDLAM